MLSVMKPENSLLCALTCETMPSYPLVMSRPDGYGQTQISAPLGNKLSIHVPKGALKEQIATALQLISAVQVGRYPWMTLDGLYRLIVTPDRHATLLANAHLLEAIGQSVAMHIDKNSAFAFPCTQGIVVILPLEIVRFALAPDNETERQYGLTTVWHELAHVHALSKQYLKKGRLQPPVKSRISPITFQAWHEFFAERHSHWPGFDSVFECQLVDAAWLAFVADSTQENVAHLLVRLASAHGRLSTNGSHEACLTAFPQVFCTNQMVSQWQACAEALELACLTIVGSGSAPDLSALEQSLEGLAERLVMHQL